MVCGEESAGACARVWRFVVENVEEGGNRVKWLGCLAVWKDAPIAFGGCCEE